MTVDAATSDGTATGGADYIATSGTLTFLPGQTTQTFTVAVTGETDIEPDETFFVNLSNAANATIAITKSVSNTPTTFGQRRFFPGRGNGRAAVTAVPPGGASRLITMRLRLISRDPSL